MRTLSFLPVSCLVVDWPGSFTSDFAKILDEFVVPGLAPEDGAGQGFHFDALARRRRGLDDVLLHALELPDVGSRVAPDEHGVPDE